MLYIYIKFKPWSGCHHEKRSRPVSLRLIGKSFQARHPQQSFFNIDKFVERSPYFVVSI